MRSQMQREASRGCKTVQCTPAAVARRRNIVLALIQKNSGLLSMQQVGMESKTVHMYHHDFGDFARQHARLQGQRFVLADGRIVALDDSLRRKNFLEATCDHGFGAVHSLVERLNSKIRAVAVDHQTGQAVAFAVHQPVGIGVRYNTPAMVFGLLYPAPKKRVVDCFDAIRE